MWLLLKRGGSGEYILAYASMFQFILYILIFGIQTPTRRHAMQDPLTFGIQTPRRRYVMQDSYSHFQVLRRRSLLGRWRQCESSPCVSFVFLVMPGVEGFPTKKRWSTFFDTCKLANIKYFALIFEDRRPKPIKTIHHCLGLDMWWAKCGVFAYPDYDLRFTPSMVQLMNAGVEQSPVGSTVTFISGNTIPLVSCPETVERLQGKIFVEHMRFPIGSIYTPFNRTMTEEQCKGSQWFSIPRQVFISLFSCPCTDRTVIVSEPHYLSTGLDRQLPPGEIFRPALSQSHSTNFSG